MMSLAHRFFVWGSIHKLEYGFNTSRETDIAVSAELQHDVSIFEKLVGIGLFHYGPRLWMVGEVEPLTDLVESSTRGKIIDRILGEYPMSFFGPGDEPIFRIRTNPSSPGSIDQYDSPPVSGTGRFDSSTNPIFYCSPDLKTSMHECRVSVEDDPQ